MSRANEPAHPHAEVIGPGDRYAHASFGMTIREHFAGLAMQGLLMQARWTPRECAEFAVEYADALIAELDRTK